jgi:hypothetical protein
LRADIALHVAKLSIAGDADDLYRGCPIARKLHSLADRIRAEIEPIQERLVHDGDLTAGRDVVRGEFSACDQRHG